MNYRKEINKCITEAVGITTEQKKKLIADIRKPLDKLEHELIALGVQATNELGGMLGVITDLTNKLY